MKTNLIFVLTFISSVVMAQLNSESETEMYRKAYIFNISFGVRSGTFAHDFRIFGFDASQFIVEKLNIGLDIDIDTSLAGDAFNAKDVTVDSYHVKASLGLGYLARDPKTKEVVGLIGRIGFREPNQPDLGNNNKIPNDATYGIKQIATLKSGAYITTSIDHAINHNYVFIDLATGNIKIGNKWYAEADLCYQRINNDGAYCARASVLWKKTVGFTTGFGNIGKITDKRATSYFFGGTLRVNFPGQ